MAPSPLTIATKSVERLVKEESFYRAELVKQEERVRRLAAELANPDPAADQDPNAEYVLRQETRAVEETKAVFAPLKERTIAALDVLEERIALAESRDPTVTGGADAATAAEELEKARAVLRTGQTAVAKDA